jgi:hypothetical protein
VPRLRQRAFHRDDLRFMRQKSKLCAAADLQYLHGLGVPSAAVEGLAIAIPTELTLIEKVSRYRAPQSPPRHRTRSSVASESDGPLGDFIRNRLRTIQLWLT